MKKGRRNLIDIHEVNPHGGIGIRLVRVVDRFPLPAERGGIPPAILLQKLITMCDHRMFPCAAPRRSPPAVPHPANVDDMKGQRGAARDDISEYLPGMRLAGERGVIETVNCNPAVEQAGLIGPGKREP